MSTTVGPPIDRNSYIDFRAVAVAYLPGGFWEVRADHFASSWTSKVPNIMDPTLIMFCCLVVSFLHFSCVFLFSGGKGICRSRISLNHIPRHAESIQSV